MNQPTYGSKLHNWRNLCVGHDTGRVTSDVQWNLRVQSGERSSEGEREGMDGPAGGREGDLGE
jgi:hypothetical protein